MKKMELGWQKSIIAKKTESDLAVVGVLPVEWLPLEEPVCLKIEFRVMWHYAGQEGRVVDLHCSVPGVGTDGRLSWKAREKVRLTQWQQHLEAWRRCCTSNSLPYLPSTSSFPELEAWPYTFTAWHMYVPESDSIRLLMTIFPLLRIRIRAVASVLPTLAPFLYHVISGLGAASGGHLMVAVPPRAPRVMDWTGCLVKVGLNPLNKNIFGKIATIEE